MLAAILFEQPLAGRTAAGPSFGETLVLPCVNVAHPFPTLLSRGADARVARITCVTQGVHICPILIDPCVDLVRFSDGPVPGDDDIDDTGHALQQVQRGEVILDRVSGVAQVEHWNQDIGKHVPGNKNPSFLDQ
ncbi:hypothetical protein SAMN04487914_14011 [Arthrobacter sp. ok909]|nr:hypothetical protein SAMN04487914_14011 [Arthrobacter sp. ok909]